MEKIPCSVIQDLLPLYLEEAVSRETKDAVQAPVTGKQQARDIRDKMLAPAAASDPVSRAVRFRYIADCRREVFTIVLPYNM